MKELPETPYGVIFAEGDITRYAHGYYGTIRARIRNLVKSRYGRTWGAIVVRCQASPGHENRVYGFSTSYEVDCLTAEIDELQAATRVLKAIDRKLRKLNDERGYPQTFEQYAMRVLEVTKVGDVYIRPQINDACGIRRVPDYPHFTLPSQNARASDELHTLEHQIIERYALPAEAA